MRCWSQGASAVASQTSLQINFNHAIPCFVLRPPHYTNYPARRARAGVLCHASQLYDLLGVDPSCDTSTIRTAYRRLARTLHPDVNPEGAAKYRALVQAYDVLRKPELRRQYDTYGLRGLGNQYASLKEWLAGEGSEDSTSAGGSGSPTSVREGQGDSRDSSSSSSASDTTDSGTWPSSEPGGLRGGDAYVVVGLTLAEAATGVEREVVASVQGACQACEGTGLDMAQGRPPVCPVCHGSGEILRTVWRPVGMRVPQLGTCPACGGSGTQAREACSRCSGEGRARVRRRVSVRVPAGVDEACVMRLHGMGDAGLKGGPAGDLVLRFKVHASENLTRQGDDLHSDLEMDVWDALLGACLPVNTVRGERLLEVPAGAQHGDVMRLEHAGIASAHQGCVSYGHHFYHLRLVVPDGSALPEPQRQKLLRLKELQGASDANSTGKEVRGSSRRRPGSSSNSTTATTTV